MQHIVTKIRYNMLSNMWHIQSSENTTRENCASIELKSEP